MKREIKFRLYFYEGKRLTYSTHTFEVTAKGLHIMLARFDENTIVGFVEFTGLKDKNGTPIYEGDIIQTIGSEGTRIQHKIIFKDGAFSSEHLKHGNIGKISQDWLNECEFKVIGNIYQNPSTLSPTTEVVER